MRTTFIMLVGLPASGKSILASKLSNKYNAKIYSDEDMRIKIYGNSNTWNNNKISVAISKNIRSDLANGINCIYDACNVNYRHRKALVREISHIDCEKICIFVATPFEQCLVNNCNSKNLPVTAIQEAYEKFSPPYYYEGWDKIDIIYYNDEFKSYYGSHYDFISKYINYNQDTIYHPLTLGQHCGKACDFICQKQDLADDKDISLSIAAMLHDCGKPWVKKFKDSRDEISEIAHYYNHEKIGSYNCFFYDVGENVDRLKVAVLIRMHMLPYFWEKNDDDKMHKKYYKLWGERLYKDIMALHAADKFAH